MPNWFGPENEALIPFNGDTRSPSFDDGIFLILFLEGWVKLPIPRFFFVRNFVERRLMAKTLVTFNIF